jgi:hypothetical protein
LTSRAPARYRPINGAVAQLGEHEAGSLGVRGSIPLSSTNFSDRLTRQAVPAQDRLPRARVARIPARKRRTTAPPLLESSLERLDGQRNRRSDRLTCRRARRAFKPGSDPRLTPWLHRPDRQLEPGGAMTLGSPPARQSPRRLDTPAEEWEKIAHRARARHGERRPRAGRSAFRKARRPAERSNPATRIRSAKCPARTGIAVSAMRPR